MSALSNVQVLDLTQRLPGPLATKILQQYGASITKGTPKNKADAFIKTDDEIFNEWYRNLNSAKTLVEFDSEEDLQSLINKSQIIIAPGGLNYKNLNLEKKVLILVNGSADGKAMHDLNALAQCSSFKLYLKNKKNFDSMIPPPYLPFAGIQYASQIALTALSGYIELITRSETAENAIIKNLYLDQSIKSIFDTFTPSKMEKACLHNGAYPCYNIYRTKDHNYIALACVEEHYFERFCDIFNLSLKIEDRFDTSNRVFNILINLFSNLTLSDIVRQVGDTDICLTPVE